MSDDYTLEDAHVASCHHPSSFILHTRMCTECSKILEDDVIIPGTDTITHHVSLAVKP